jgi:hypothetical protein
MLVDPSLEGHVGSPSVNDSLAPLPCPLTSIERIAARMKPNSVPGKRDLLIGFCHVVLAVESRKCMGVVHPVSGRIRRWVVLPQGTSQSPAVFAR